MLCRAKVHKFSVKSFLTNYFLVDKNFTKKGTLPDPFSMIICLLFQTFNNFLECSFDIHIQSNREAD